MCSHVMARSDVFVCPRESNAWHVVSHTCTHCGPIYFVYTGTTYVIVTVSTQTVTLCWVAYFNLYANCSVPGAILEGMSVSFRLFRFD